MTLEVREQLFNSNVSVHLNRNEIWKNFSRVRSCRHDSKLWRLQRARPARSSLVHLSQATAAGAVSGVYAVADNVSGAAFHAHARTQADPSPFRRLDVVKFGSFCCFSWSPLALGATFTQETGKLLVDHFRRHHYLRVSQFVLTLFLLASQ